MPRPAAARPSPRSPAYRGAARRPADATGVSGLLIAIAAAAALALFYVSQSTHVAQVGYEIDVLEAQLADVVSEQEQLILDISAARSPAVIERAALQMGLRPIDETRIAFAGPAPETASAITASDR